MKIGDRYTKLCSRWNWPGHVHELTFSCYKGRPFLAREQTRRYVIEAINNARNKHHFHVWAYVLMPNHVHLLIFPQATNYSISNILTSIKQPVSRKIVNYLRKHNPAGLKPLATGGQKQPYRFWQKGGGYDRNITSDDTLLNSVRYIHNNPVRKELVSIPDQWRFSSARDWQARDEVGPLRIDFDSWPDL